MPLNFVRNGLKSLFVFFAAASAALAGQPGDYSIQLLDNQGAARNLGRLTLQTAGQDGQGYRIDWDDTQFSNHFLSMRPFKCLPHPSQLICHLPYPYEIRRVITDSDLTDLEYDLLFLHKTPQEYGINAWNGLYFQLAPTANGFTGELRETDLNVLQAPPDDGNLRPIDAAELYEASEKHWPRRVVIEPISSDGMKP